MFSEGMCLSFLYWMILFPDMFVMVNSQGRDPCDKDLTVIAGTRKSHNPKHVSVEEVVEEGNYRSSIGAHQDAVDCWTLMIRSWPQLKLRCLEYRADCYGKIGDREKQEADLELIEELEEAQKQQARWVQTWSTRAQASSTYGPLNRPIGCDELD